MMTQTNDVGLRAEEAAWRELTLLESTGSTNDDAICAARAGAPHGTAVASGQQSAGRGRRGHVWRSPAGGVYLSVVLRPDVSMQYYVGLPIVCALGVLDALREDLGVADAALKWPNDVLRSGGKLAGMLVEAGSSVSGPFAVFGVGLNLVPPERSYAEPGGTSGAPALRPAYLSDRPASAAPGIDEPARAVRSRVIARVDDWAERVREGGAAAGPIGPVLDEYCASLPLLGRPCQIFDPAGNLTGTGVFAGVDAWGRATVVLPGGREVEYAAEQASLRGIDG